MPLELTRAVRQALAENADAGKAEGMRAYMKSSMPYHGVQTPLRRRLFKSALRDHPLAAQAEWRTAVLELWREAGYREERYCAIDLAAAPRYRDFRTLDALPMFEEMVVSGAWWDFVDDIAGHLLRELLECYPEPMAQTMREWSVDADLWKRRASILCQLTRKKATDLPLLFDCIEPNLRDPEFFIRKAIGWALRDLAWSDLGTVETYVAQHYDALSPLSRREALKNADKIREGARKTRA